MKDRMTTLVLLLIAIFFFPCSLWADSLKPEEISADAKWAAHIDVEKFFSSQIGSLFKKALEEEGDLKQIEAFGTIFEFDPFEDLYGATAYGLSFEKEEGVALIKGRFEKKKIISLMRIEGKHTEIDHRDFIIHEWKDGSDHFFVALPKTNLVVISNSLDLTKEALDVLAGKKDNLTDRRGLKGLRSLPGGTFIAASAQGFGDVVDCDGEPEAAVLKMADEVSMSIGEVEGDDFLDVTLSARDAKTAKQVNDILRGLVALGSLFGEEEPELAQLINMLDVEQDGKTVRIRAAIPAEELCGKIKLSMN
ncbi:MAG: hypothetical protein KJ645_01895 [Planctomycetes bacterium]|nr:hypothetical protein [Planctomycetota bacterium]